MIGPPGRLWPRREESESVGKKRNDLALRPLPSPAAPHRWVNWFITCPAFVTRLGLGTSKPVMGVRANFQINGGS